MATFDETAVATIRKPIARVTVYWSGALLDNFEVSTPGTGDNWLHAELPAMIDQVLDENKVVPRKWFQCDNKTPLNQMYLAPGTVAELASNQVGWWGTDLSNAVTGAFTTPQQLNLKTAARPVVSLRVVGDSAYAQYPVDFTVKIFSGLGGAILKHTTTVTGNAAVTWTKSGIVDNAGLPITDATNVLLTITKWSAVSAVAKIAEFYEPITQVYTGDDIKSINILEESEVKDATIPAGNISCNELDLALQNIDDQYFPANTSALLRSSVKAGRKIEVELGFDIPGTGAEYVSMGTFWSGDWKVAEKDANATTTARDRMERLRKMTFSTSEVYANYTIGDLAEIVLDAATVEMEDLIYNIHADLYGSDYTVPIAWFEKQSYFDALKLLATACIGRVFSDRDDVIQFLPYEESGTYEYEITADNYFERTQPVNTEEVANTIEVTTQPVIKKTGETLYTSSEAIAIAAGAVTSYTIQYTKRPVGTVAMSLVNQDTFVGTLTAVEYAWGADITVTCTTAGSFKISVTGEYYDVDGAQVITSKDDDSIFEFGIRRYELAKNAFIQTAALAKKIADALLEIHKNPSKDIELRWRGNPHIKLNTVIRAPEYVRDAVSQKADFAVYKQSVAFDGTLTVTTCGWKIREFQELIIQDTDSTSFVMQDTDNSGLIVLQA